MFRPFRPINMSSSKDNIFVFVKLMSLKFYLEGQSCGVGGGKEEEKDLAPSGSLSK